MIHTKFSSVLSPSQTDCLPLFQLEFDEYDSEQSIDYGGAESAHVICILSNKYFHTAKIQKINYISKKYGRNVSCLVQTSFRFHLTSIDDGQNADTLTLGYAIPAVRGHWGLAPVRHYSCRAYQKWDAPSQVHPTANLNNQ